jgi:hypothetical protein
MEFARRLFILGTAAAGFLAYRPKPQVGIYSNTYSKIY